MSDYRRFYSYIYCYEQGQKKGNAGFAKIELYDAQSTVELHLHGVRLSAPTAELYLFVREDGQLLSFLLGSVPFTNGSADRRFVLDEPSLADSGHTIADAAGIFFAVGSSICLISQWDEAATDWSAFRIYEKKEKQDAPAPAEKPAAAEIHSAELSAAVQRQPVIAVAPRENPRSEPEAGADPAKAPSHGQPWEKTWEKMQDSFPRMQPFSDPQICGIRIELKELRLLPPSNWHLCNNGFLLHGFLSYRHLMLGELPSQHGKKWFVGVPGIRYRQEHVLAAMFGFTEFLPEKDSADAQSPFGYWYTLLTQAD